MNLKCLFRYEDGQYCKRWAQKGSRFCYNHQPQGLDGPGGAAWPLLHPFTRLATLSDLFDLLRESLNSARMGTMPTGQAASICSLAALWLRTYEKLECTDRLQALTYQILPSLVDSESAISAERLAAATAETERAAAFAAELDHIAKFGPPAPQPDDAAQPPASDASQPPAANFETSPYLRPQTSPSGSESPQGPGPQSPSPGSELAHQSSPQTPQPAFEPLRQPVNLSEAQAKLEAMLAEQRASKSPANPNGG